MSDYNSSLPVRTQTTGDLIAELAGATGNTITSTTISSKEALDVNVANSITASNPSVGVNGAAGPSSSTQAGGLVSTSAPSYTSGNLEPFSTTLAGALRVDGSASTQPISGTVTANQGTSPWSDNIAQIAGATPSATNALPAQIATAGAFVSASNPLPVTIESSIVGTAVNDYKDASAIASGSTDNHDYTVTAGKTLTLKQLAGSGSGKAKMEVQIESGVATGTFASKFVQFNSTADTNMGITLQAPILVAAGVRVRLIMTNRDLSAQDLYSTISGSEA